jgi:hypothetical protein
MLRSVFHRAALLTSCCVLLACGRKEATDPRDVLGDEMHHGGVDGRTGEVYSGPAPGGEDAGRPATADECRQEAEHLVALGIDLAILEETDPALKQRLQAEREQALKSKEAQQMAREATQECLDRGDTLGETNCILKARRQVDIERCDP